MDEFTGLPGDHPVVLALAGARECLAQARAGWTASLGPVAVTELAQQAWAAVAAAEATFLAVVGAVDRAGAAVAVGAPSTQAWLRGALRLAPDEARSTVRLARAVDGELAATGAALAGGLISRRQSQVIAGAVEDLPGPAGGALRAAAEEHLLGQAAHFDPVDLARLGRRVLGVVDPEGAEAAAAQRLEREERRAARSEFRMCPDGHGSERLSGRLDGEGAAILRQALDPLAAPRPTGPEGPDPRTAGQRYADALVELARRRLAAGDLPETGGERPHVVVTMRLADLRDGDGIGWWHTGEPLSATLARRLACDARVLPVVLGGAGEILDVGRTQRTFTAALRRALVLRDGGCAFPACDRPPSWCEGHHILHWVDGGPTSLDNGVLLCGHHHRLIHLGEWHVRMGADRLPEFIPPAWIDPTRRPRRNNRNRHRARGPTPTPSGAPADADPV